MRYIDTFSAICLGFVIGFFIGAILNFTLSKPALERKLCKYEIEYCSKEELLKIMKDK
jgi:hypothetical protein